MLPDKYFSIQYCITCEEVVPVLRTDECHSVEVDGYVDLCHGPFTSCPPPDNFDLDWDLTVEEPDGDEMFIINRNAEQLLADFESENKK